MGSKCLIRLDRASIQPVDNFVGNAGIEGLAQAPDWGFPWMSPSSDGLIYLYKSITYDTCPCVWGTS
jgi:hypothetical protein